MIAFFLIPPQKVLNKNESISSMYSKMVPLINISQKNKPSNSYANIPVCHKSYMKVDITAYQHNYNRQVVYLQQKYIALTFKRCVIPVFYRWLLFRLCSNYVVLCVFWVDRACVSGTQSVNEHKLEQT